jgi:hypothetical protein
MEVPAILRLANHKLFNLLELMNTENALFIINYYQITQTSFPEAPASFLKQVDYPAYFIGRFFSSIHSPRYIAEMGCSEVAIK